MVKDGVLDVFDPVLVEKTSKLVNAALVDVDKLDDGAAPDPALDAEIVDGIGELEDTVLNSDAVEAESTALIEGDGLHSVSRRWLTTMLLSRMRLSWTQ